MADEPKVDSTEKPLEDRKALFQQLRGPLPADAFKADPANRRSHALGLRAAGVTGLAMVLHGEDQKRLALAGASQASASPLSEEHRGLLTTAVAAEHLLSRPAVNNESAAEVKAVVDHVLGRNGKDNGRP